MIPSVAEMPGATGTITTASVFGLSVNPNWVLNVWARCVGHDENLLRWPMEANCAKNKRNV
jgi:hypothetical protein